MDIAENGNSLIAAWETGGELYWAPVTSDAPQSIDSVRAPGEAKGRQHPRVAINDRGELLFVWTEESGWQRGGLRGNFTTHQVSRRLKRVS